MYRIIKLALRYMNDKSFINYICYNWFPTVADHCLDYSEEVYRQAGVSKLHEKSLVPELVSDGDIVFVKTDFIYSGIFQKEFLPRIKNQFILISGISSFPVSSGSPINPILNNDYVYKWFCTNAPVIDDTLPDKVVPLPIGFEEIHY